MNGRFRSLQAQLVLRLAVAFVVATIVVVAALVFAGIEAADSLGDDELEHRAIEIARFVTRGADGALQLTLPEKLDQLYHSPSRTRMLAVHTVDGTLVAASAPEFAALAGRSRPHRSRHPFELYDFGPTIQDYNGITVRVDNDAGPLFVTVAAASDSEALARALIRRLVIDLVWGIPAFAAVMLVIAAWSIRRSLRP